MEDIEAVAKDVVDAAIKVHKALGPGLLESAYQQCHVYELRQRGRKILTEVTLPLTYEGQKIDAGYKIDVWVDNLVIVENKTVETLLPIHEAQLMTYLKLSGCKIGFLLNWNVTLMKHGIKRVVMNLSGPTSYPKHFKKG
ncbi:MAG: GxxExxY protein [Anaerolineales bacterium]|nr:GxxExxY protein [Anaerolineales bacterium]